MSNNVEQSRQYLTKLLKDKISQLKKESINSSDNFFALESTVLDSLTLEIAVDCKRYVLITGEAGIGKTTALIKIAERLLKKADNDKNSPIPIILDLSSWQVEQSIAEWIKKEIGNQYQSEGINLLLLLLEKGNFALLLDGFDKLNGEEQKKCIGEINRFLKDYKNLGSNYLVVCSNEQQQGLHELFNLEINPLTEEQIKHFLESNNRDDLYEVLKNDQSLIELVKIPLFLKILTVVFSDKLNYSTLTKEILFKEYIRKQIKKSIDFDQCPYFDINVSTREDKLPDAVKNIQTWLKFLAKNIKENRGEFSPENIDLNWLSFSRKYKKIYYGIIVIIYTINFTIIGLILFHNDLRFSLLFGLLVGGVCLGWNPGLSKNIDLLEAELPWFSDKGIWHGPLTVLSYIIIGGVIGGILGGSWGAYLGELPRGLVGGSVIIGLLAGLSQGGNSAIRYLVIRLLLLHNRKIPWNYHTFLEYASLDECKCKLLKKSNKSYQFIHGLLLEYLCEQEE